MTSSITHSAESVDPRQVSKSRETISAFIVCYNEEDQIRKCIESVSFCDEVIVIDSRSDDGTVEIAKSLGAKVIQRDWPGYRRQKEFGLSQASSTWVLNLDADERVSPELRDAIIEVLERSYREKAEGLPSTCKDGYDLSRVVFYLGRWWRKGGWYPEYRVRLFRKEVTTWGGKDPHEKAIVNGSIGKLSGELQHYTYRCMSEQLNRLHGYATIAAQEDHSRGRRFRFASLILNPCFRTFKFYVLKKGYREGMAGFIVAVIEGYYTFLKYAKLWELQRTCARESSEHSPAVDKTDSKQAQSESV
jgi:glycosyltransferase involved in cell wall biosynthesis